MERENARQKEEKEILNAQRKAKDDDGNVVTTVGGVEVTTSEPDSSAQDKATMDAEKEREKEEKRVQKDRDKEAKEHAKTDVEGEPWAGKTSPFVAGSGEQAPGTKATRTDN
jgi:hypothetical protein